MPLSFVQMGMFYSHVGVTVGTETVAHWVGDVSDSAWNQQAACREPLAVNYEGATPEPTQG